MLQRRRVRPKVSKPGRIDEARAGGEIYCDIGRGALLSPDLLDIFGAESLGAGKRDRRGGTDVAQKHLAADAGHDAVALDVDRGHAAALGVEPGDARIEPDVAAGLANDRRQGRSRCRSCREDKSRNA